MAQTPTPAGPDPDGAETTRTRILDAAEARIRHAGYNGFSFRDIANDVGIKSASVHHHFPTKDALVTELTNRYTERFLAAMGDEARGTALIEAYRTAFRRSLEEDGKMCLCGMLGAESSGLPASVNHAARDFFSRVTDHLSEGLEGHDPEPRRRALEVLAQLEGALILARTQYGLETFDEASKRLL